MAHTGRLAGWTLAVALLAACGEDDVGVTLLFDRGTTDPTVHPFPSDQYMGDVVLDGFSESQTALLPFLRQLRFTAQTGWSPATALRIPFTPVRDEPDRWIDLDTVDDAVRVFRLDDEGATRVALGEIVYRDASGALIVRPRAPWAAGTHAVAVLEGRLATRGGGAVARSADASRIRTAGDPETNEAFAAVADADPDITNRGDTLAFWTFTVVDATGQMALLGAYIDGKVPVDRAGADEILDITPIMPVEGRELAVGGARVLAEGDAALTALFTASGVEALPRDKIGKIVGGAIATPVFVSDPQPSLEALFLNHTFLGRNPLVPFQPSNPLSLSRATPSRLLPYVMVIPKQHATPMPVLVAIHGVDRGKEDWLAFANAACATGHALIAIDLYQHGARQADIDVPEGDFSGKVDPILLAQGIAFPDPFINPTFLARTRDKLRQSVVDQLALIRLLSAGDGANPLIDFDGDAAPDTIGPIRVVGQSLGAMVATVVVALSPAIDRVILNVPGGVLAQIVGDSPRISKDLDVLVYAVANAAGIGLLAGSERVMVPDGPERELFTRVAETITAAVDPLVYAPAVVSGRLGNAGPRVLVQLAHKDDVVPNNANTRFAQALAAGADLASDVPQVTPVLFPLDLVVVDAQQLPTLPIAITQFEGGHGFLLDFTDVAVTSAAQAQAATFLAVP